jgi:hypothetical protein
MRTKEKLWSFIGSDRTITKSLSILQARFRTLQKIPGATTKILLSLPSP